MKNHIDQLNKNYDDYNQLCETYSAKLSEVSFGEKFTMSFGILINAFRVFCKYPVLLIPVVFGIIINLSLAYLLVLPYIDNIEQMPENVPIYITLAVCICIYSTYTICSFIMLQLIRQITMGGKSV